MSTDATTPVIEGHEHCRVEIDEGKFMMIWPTEMSVETLHFVEHMINGILTRQRRRLRITDLDDPVPPERFRK